MPIVEHPTLEYRVKTPWVYERCLVVECDFCRDRALKVGNDAGEAADAARKEGFETVPGEKLGDPKRWQCPRCGTKEKRHV